MIFPNQFLAATGVATLLAALLAGAPTANAAGDDQCVSEPGMDFLCGPENAEDMVWMPGTGRFIASGLAGRLYTVDPETHAVEALYPHPSARVDHNAEWFADCPEPPDLEAFSPHGIDLIPIGDNRFRLYVVTHGSRESVEVFDIDARGETPLATWTGCVEMPEGDSINAIAALADGGFYTTRISHQSETFALEADEEGGITGFVYEWRPGTGLARVPGSDMSYPNGIVASADGRYAWVASWGRQRIVRFAVGETWERDGEAALDFRPDNLRWAADGRILTAGQRLAAEPDCGMLFCFESWEVAAIQGDTLAVTNLGGGEPQPGFIAATAAISAQGGYWVGTFVGDRLLFVPEPPEH